MEWILVALVIIALIIGWVMSDKGKSKASLVFLSVIIIIAGVYGCFFEGMAATVFSSAVIVFLVWKCYFDSRRDDKLLEEIRTLKDMLEQNDRSEPNLQKSETEYLQNSNGNAAYNKQG